LRSSIKRGRVTSDMEGSPCWCYRTVKLSENGANSASFVAYGVLF